MYRTVLIIDHFQCSSLKGLFKFLNPRKEEQTRFLKNIFCYYTQILKLNQGKKGNFKTDIQKPTVERVKEKISGFSIIDYFYFDSFPFFCV